MVNKWFALQATSNIPGNVENVRNLLNHLAFDMRNPNKVYSLIGGFCSSPINFHAKDGSGYKFLGEIVMQLDKINPQVFFFKMRLSYSIFLMLFDLYSCHYMLLFTLPSFMDRRWPPEWFQTFQGGGVLTKLAKIMPK